MKNKELCEKCKKYHYCDKHHLLPKQIFGEGETHNLCKNCHDEFHRSIGYKYSKKKNKQGMEFYFEKYFRWLMGLSIIAVLFYFFVN